jgi:hypothetical protein
MNKNGERTNKKRNNHRVPVGSERAVGEGAAEGEWLAFVFRDFNVGQGSCLIL